MTPSPWDRLSRKVHLMHTMWNKATGDLTTDQMNHHERSGVLPIAFSLLHFVTGEDRHTSNYLLGAPGLWESEVWAERIGGNLPGVRRGTAVDVAELAQLGSADEWLNYQRAVFARTEQGMAALPASSYEKIVHDVLPEEMHGSFVGGLAGPEGPVMLSDIIDGFIFQHGIRHLGEIEHARSLLGLRGVS